MGAGEGRGKAGGWPHHVVPIHIVSQVHHHFGGIEAACEYLSHQLQALCHLIPAARHLAILRSSLVWISATAVPGSCNFGR